MGRPSFSLDAFGRAALISPAAVNPIDGSQTTNHANSTSPTSAALSNTVPGYTAMGGRFQFAAVAGAATDYALFAYHVPAGFRLLVTSISISVMVTGAALVGASVLDWALGIRGTAPSLATASIIRIPLGMQGFLALVGIGEAATPDLTRVFDPELVIEHDQFLHVILQIPVGGVAINLVYRGDVVIHGLFEAIVP